MKILIATETYTPYVNGIITSIVNLKTGLEAKGHEIKIITLSDTVHSYKENEVYYFGSKSTEKIYPGVRRKIISSKKERKEILDWEPDIIHTQGEFSSFYVARKISVKQSIPMVHTYHTLYQDYTHYFSKNKEIAILGIKYLLHHITSNIDSLIVPTKKIYKIIDSYKLKCPLKILPTGISLDKFKESVDKVQLRLDLGISKDQFVMIFVGRISIEKNIHEIVRFLKNNPQKNVLLLLVGDGPEKNNIENFVQKHNMTTSVQFTGMIDPADIPKYYAIADIFVSASNSETQGLTYLEALASGIPLLCKQDECLEDLLEENKNGYTYTNEQDFFEKLEKIQIPENLKTMSEYAKLSANKFSNEIFITNIEEFYKGIISNHKKKKIYWIKRIVKALNGAFIGLILWIFTAVVYIREFFLQPFKKK